MKKIYLALIALAITAVSCDKAQPEDPNPYVPETGAQVYIDNTTTTFYVKTAEEKAAKSAELAALTKAKNFEPATPVNDSTVAVPVIRKNASGEYETELDVVMGDMTLFSINRVTYLKDDQEVVIPVVPIPTDFDGDEKEDGYIVKFTYPDEIAKINLIISFDITKIAANKEYSFTASLGEEVEASSFGASKISFGITHATTVHNPWVVIGELENFTDTWYEFGSANVMIAIHENDFTDDSFIEKGGEKIINPDKTQRKLKTQDYYRFCIPYYLYQLALGLVEQGIFSEGDEKYFENCDGIVFQLDKNYNAVWDYSAKKYASPLAKNIADGGNQYLRGAWGYSHNKGTISSILYDGYGSFNGGSCITSWYFYTTTSYSNITHEANKYDIMLMLMDMKTQSLYGATCDFTFTWKTNDLVNDWSNFFKVIYDITDPNCDISYIKSTTGSVTSEFTGTTIIDASIAEGYDKLYKNNVYCVMAGTEYNLAVLVSEDGKAKLAADQKFPGSALGDNVLASQSDKYLSSVEFDEKGSIKTITLGVKVHYEGSTTAIKEYKEVFTATAPSMTIDDFCGKFTQYSLYMKPEGADTDSSYVTISKISETSVKISGLIFTDAAASVTGGENAYLLANFNPSTSMLEIPAQYFIMENKFDAAYMDDPTYGKFFCYFQPGSTYYGYNSKGKYYYSYIYEPQDIIGLTFVAEGQLTFARTKYNDCTYDPDGYQVAFYTADGQGGFAPDTKYYGELYCTYYFTRLLKEGVIPTSMPSLAEVKKDAVSSPKLSNLKQSK